MRAVAQTLIRNPRAAHMILGVTVGAFANYGFYGFAPLYFNRAFGLNYTTTGLIAALTGGIAVGVGIVAGGYLADRLGRRSARAYALVPAVGTLLATPFYLLTTISQNWRWAAVFLGIAGFFQYASLGPYFRSRAELRCRAPARNSNRAALYIPECGRAGRRSVVHGLDHGSICRPGIAAAVGDPAWIARAADFLWVGVAALFPSRAHSFLGPIRLDVERGPASRGAARTCRSAARHPGE